MKHALKTFGLILGVLFPGLVSAQDTEPVILDLCTEENAILVVRIDETPLTKERPTLPSRSQRPSCVGVVARDSQGLSQTVGYEATRYNWYTNAYYFTWRVSGLKIEEEQSPGLSRYWVNGQLLGFMNNRAPTLDGYTMTLAKGSLANRVFICRDHAPLQR